MATSPAIRARLMFMMFLQFFVWGAWWATGGNYMRTHGMSDVIYVAYLSSPIASIVAPFFLGMIADRFFPVQKVLGILHVLSGAFVIAAPLLAERAGSPTLFVVALFVHMLCYMPTVGLATATSFHLLIDKEREFPLVRVCGTLGWIAAGILVSRILHADTVAVPMYVSGLGSLLLGIYAFTLPHVPPAGAGRPFSMRDVFGVDALKALGSRPFYIFLAAVTLTSVPLATYYAFVPVFLRDAGVADVSFKMTFGQMSEVLFLLLLPWFFLRLGIKGVLLAGMLAWMLRYALFMMGASDAVAWMLLLAIALHGPCYDFVYVAGQVYIDKKASPAIRAQAQGLFVLATYGVGQGVGTFLFGEIFNRSVAGTQGAAALPYWQVYWIFPLAFASVVTAMFLIGFRDRVSPVRAA
jgi:nucleoside transporter